MNSSATKSTPIHVLAVYDSTRAWVVPNLIAKMTGKTFLESEDAQAAYKMVSSPSSSAASSKESSTSTQPTSTPPPPTNRGGTLNRSVWV